tara:strand:+ start:724 stop:888 length:165 start_codon:yes stop_codon:yes gene_type:complete
MQEPMAIYTDLTAQQAEDLYIALCKAGYSAMIQRQKGEHWILRRVVCFGLMEDE